MNSCFENLKKIEFVVTYACSGKCKHCSEGSHTACGEHIDGSIAADVVRKVVAAYDIKTVMTFGGEPLLYPEVVYSIHTAAREMAVPRRQVITNGYFSRDPACIDRVAEALARCGVNDVLLSVDAFHQEMIPLDVVMRFAEALQKNQVPLRLQPAWLVSPEDNNPYNQKTREVLQSFSRMEIPTGSGNVIFPEGNALVYLKEYFTSDPRPNPYQEDPNDVHCLSFDPDGSVLNGNVYQQDIFEILRGYVPG